MQFLRLRGDQPSRRLGLVSRGYSERTAASPQKHERPTLACRALVHFFAIGCSANEQHLLVGRQRPEAVGYQRLEAVGRAARLSISGRTSSLRCFFRFDIR